MAQKPSIEKEDFIDFLCSATPQEINQMILDRGKPAKCYCPVYVFKNKEMNKEDSHDGENDDC